MVRAKAHVAREPKEGREAEGFRDRGGGGVDVVARNHLLFGGDEGW